LPQASKQIQKHLKWQHENYEHKWLLVRIQQQCWMFIEGYVSCNSHPLSIPSWGIQKLHFSSAKVYPTWHPKLNDCLHLEVVACLS
jgi:hypothetical protein